MNTKLCAELILAASLAAAGCVFDPAPMDELAAANASMREALGAGARRLVHEARADARLASVKATSVSARKGAAALTREFRAFNSRSALRAAPEAIQQTATFQ